MPAEAAVIDNDPTDAAPPPEKLFNSMTEQLNKGLAEAQNAPKPDLTKPKMDTGPVDPPELKKEKLERKEPEKEPVKEQPKDREEYSAKKAADWKKVVTERDEWQQKATRLPALETELAELKKKVADAVIKPEEVEALRKELEKRETILSQVALERTPKFQDHFNQRFEQIRTRALDSVGKDKAEQVKAILEAPQSPWRKNALNEVITNLESEVDKQMLINAVLAYDDTRTERDRELANSKEGMLKLRELEQKKAKEAQDKQQAYRTEMANSTLKKAAETYEAFKEKEGDNEHNAEVAKNRKLVENFILGSEPLGDDLLASLPVRAAEADRLSKVVPTLEAKVKELEEALASYRTASPKAGEGGKTPAGDKPKGFKDLYLANMPG